MNTTRGLTAQVPGQRSKTVGDHVKSALPWLGGALALGAAGAGAYYGSGYAKDKYTSYKYPNRDIPLDGGSTRFKYSDDIDTSSPWDKVN